MHSHLKRIVVLLLMSLVHCHSPAKTISPLNLLLPLSSDTKVEFLIQAFHGCYKFSSSDPSIISITPLPAELEANGCQTQAIARVEVFHPVRSIVWLTAEEEISGTTLRCESRVAEISKLEIMTRLRTLDLNVYETIETTAYDFFGNAFSTLEGLKFDWTISQHGNLAEISSFRDSNLQVSERRQRIENSRALADQIVLKTNKLGKIILEAKINDAKYAHITSRVALHIAEHIIFQPENEVNLLRCSFVQLTAFTLEGDKKNRKIKELSSFDNFKFDVKDKSLASVDPQGKIQSKQVLGETVLEVHNNKNTENGIQIKLNVVAAEKIDAELFESDTEDWRSIVRPSLSFTLTPKRRLEDLPRLDSWITIVGKVYILKLVAQSARGNEIYLNNEDIHWGSVEEGFEVLDKHQHLLVLRAMRPSTFRLTAQISKQNCPQASLTFSNKIAVELPVLVLLPRNHQNQVFLPPLSLTHIPQTLYLSIIGGSDSYLCYSDEPSIVNVTASNVLVVKERGECLIRCQDAANHRNVDNFLVRVESFDMVKADQHNEGIPLEKILVPWRVAGASGEFYANCTSIKSSFTVKSLRNPSKSFPFVDSFENSYPQYLKQLKTYLREQSLLNPYMSTLKWTSKDFFAAYLSRDQGYQVAVDFLMDWNNAAAICGFAAIKSEEPDHLLLTFKADSLPAEECQVKIHDPISVKVSDHYNPAIFSTTPLLAFGTSATLIVSGGPQSWTGSEPASIAVRTSENGKLATVSVNSALERTTLEFHCKPVSQLGSTSELSLELTQDITIHVAMHNKVTKETPRPVSVTALFTIQCGLPSSIRHSPISEFELGDFSFINKFKPVLHLRSQKVHFFVLWAFNDLNKPFWNFTSADISASLLNSTFGGKFQPAHSVQFSQDLIKLKDHGSLLLEMDLPAKTGTGVSVVTLRLAPPHPKSLQSSVRIESTQQLDLDPSFSEVFLNAKNEVTFGILNGSGRFKITLDDDLLASVSYLQDARKIKVRPMKKGQCFLRVQDIGVESPSEAVAEIKVVDVDSLTLAIKDKALENNRETILSIECSAALKRQIAALPIRISATPSTGLKITKTSPTEYLIKGVDNGEFIIQADIDDQLLSSKVVLKVYPAIELFPKQLVLMPNCLGFFRVIGGPLDLFTSEYQIKTKNEEQFGKLVQKQPGFYSFEAGKSLSEGEIEFEVISFGKTLAHIKLRVIVAYPTEIISHGPRRLLNGGSIIVTALPKFNYHEFSPAFCKLQFSVTLAGDSGAISLTPLTLSQNENPSFLSVLVKSEKVGSVQLQFDLEIKAGSVKLSHSKTILIQVVENHAFDTSQLFSSSRIHQPSFSDSSFLIPPNAVLGFSSRLHVSVSSLDNVVAFKDKNSVMSRERFGSDSLVLTDLTSDVFSRIHVQVATPAHLVVGNVLKTVYLHGKSSVTLSVHFMDSIGRLFSKTASPLTLELITSDPNVVSVTYDEFTSELLIETKTDGKALLFLKSKEFPSLIFPLLLAIGTMITPCGPLVIPVGAEVHFVSDFEAHASKSIFSGNNHPNGIWDSSDISVLDINPSNGKAIAKSAGTGKITWKSALSPEVFVSVVEPDSLQLLPFNSTMTNINAHKAYQDSYALEYQLGFRNKLIQLTWDDKIDNKLMFTCTSNNPAVVVKARTVEAPASSSDASPTTRFFCSLQFPFKDKLLSDLRITAELVSKTPHSNFKVSSTDSIPVLSAFILDFIDRRVELNRQELSKEVRVKTTSRLQLSTSENLKKFVTSEFDSQINEQRISIVFPGDFNEELEGEILIVNGETKQTEKITVLFDKTVSLFSFFGSFSPFGPISFSDFSMILVCLAVLYLIGKAFKNDSYEQSDLSLLNPNLSRYSKTKRD